MGSPPLVSVVLPTRNRVELLRRAVESVRAQSEQSLELIVVDDASSDETHAYLEKLAAADDRVRLVHNTIPRGGGGARNEGVKISRGEWIAFIDDDDEWLPTKLERQLGTLKATAGAVACSCSYVVRSVSGASRVIAARANSTVQDLLMHNWLGGASVCVCLSGAIREIGGFDSKLRAAQDLDLWVRLRQKGPVAVCPEALVVHRVHKGARITTNPQSQYMGVRRFHLKHRSLMSVAIRRHRLSYCSYVMSTQATRRPERRLRYLVLAALNATPRYSLGFIKQSLPLLIRDVLASTRHLGQPPRAGGK